MPSSSSSLPKPSFEVGEVIDGNWEIVRELGRGGCGVVYEVRKCRGRITKGAMKAEAVREESKRDQTLAAEASVLRVMQSSLHFCRLFQAARYSPSCNIIIMSLVGRSLSWLRRQNPSQRFTLSTAVRLAIQCIQMASDEYRRPNSVSSKRKRILKDFAETTSAHGCALISKSSNNFKRVFWIFATVVFWLLCGYQVWVAVWKYFQYPTTVSVRIRHMTNITFPAVTICNLNPIRASYLAEHMGADLIKELKKGALVTNMTNEEWIKRMEESRTADHITDEVRYLYKHFRLIYDKKIDIEEAGHDLKVMLIDCTFQSTKCTAENFTRWEHGMYGNCYTMIVSRRFNAFVGPLYGLSLTLYVEDNEYLTRHSQGSGFKVQIHPQEYVPFPEDKGFTISPGVMTSVGMKQQRISRMPLPYDGTDCGDIHRLNKAGSSWIKSSLYHQRYFEVLRTAGYSAVVNYTSHSCVKSCYQKHLAKDCGCVDPSVASRQDVMTFYANSSAIPEACDMTTEKSVKCVRESIGNTTRSGACEQECPQSCFEYAYQARIATALWPRASYYQRVKDRWQLQNLTRAMKSDYNQAKTNLARLEIYYEELNYESMVESAAIDVWDLLSNIGGTLGLYVGMSFLTLGEFAELIFKCIALPARERLRAASVDKLG